MSGCLIRNEQDDSISTVVQPDLSVICELSRLDEHGCCGASDFIIEIISPGTASRDLIDKLALYECDGICEYWIIPPWTVSSSSTSSMKGERAANPSSPAWKGSAPCRRWMASNWIWKPCASDFPRKQAEEAEPASKLRVRQSEKDGDKILPHSADFSGIMGQKL